MAGFQRDQLALAEHIYADNATLQHLRQKGKWHVHAVISFVDSQAKLSADDLKNQAAVNRLLDSIMA